MLQSQMSTQNKSVAPIKVYTNGNKYDSTYLIMNRRHVRTFDSFLDLITTKTNADCAIRRIYTPHGRTQVGSLSAIQPGASYVAVSRGPFKKLPYGKAQIAATSSSTGTATTKSRRQKAASSRVQRSYEDQMKTQKTLYVHRNGFNELPKPIFFSKRMLRSMTQVLDMVQEKIGCGRAIVSLHKVNGLTINDVVKLQSEGRYVAVEQGQRFRHISYDQIDDGPTSPRKLKLPMISNGLGVTSFRSPSEGKPHTRHPSNESNQGQTGRGTTKLRLPVLKQTVNEPQGFQIVYGYPKKEDKDATTYRSNRNTLHYQYAYHQGNNHDGNQANSYYGNNDHVNHHHGNSYYNNNVHVNHSQRHSYDNDRQGNYHYDNQNQSLHSNRYQDNRNGDNASQRHPPKENYQDKRIRAGKREEEVTKSYGGHNDVGHHGISKQRDQKAGREKEDVKLPEIVHVPKPPTKPSIAHPKRQKRPERPQDNVPKGVVYDQRFVSRENQMAKTKQYIVTREQQLLIMNKRDSKQAVANAVHVYATDTRSKGLEHENEKRKYVEEWVDSTVDEKEKEDEINSAAKQLVLNAIQNAGGCIESDETNNNIKRTKKNEQKKSFYENEKSNGVKYHRVFGT